MLRTTVKWKIHKHCLRPNVTNNGNVEDTQTLFYILQIIYSTELSISKEEAFEILELARGIDRLNYFQCVHIVYVFIELASYCVCFFSQSPHIQCMRVFHR